MDDRRTSSLRRSRTTFARIEIRGSAEAVATNLIPSCSKLLASTNTRGKGPNR